MSYKKGDIVIVKFPFILKEGTDIYKGRPALVISDDKIQRRYNDIILAAITSHVPEDVMELEIVMERVKMTGLLKKSLLRLDFMMTVPEDLISRKIGEIPTSLMKEVDQKLKSLFGIDAN